MSDVHHATNTTCDCCKDIAPLVPRPRGNTSGKVRIEARIGTQAAFKADMLAALARRGSLRRLSSREDDDPTVALLDGWASVLDVLSFYQEQIANEGYMRTAEERRSVGHMAAGVGYKLRPGVGSETYLAFTCEATPSTPIEVPIPAGTQAQSTPAPDETAQIFETKTQIIGRPEWNALRPRLMETAPVRRFIKTIYLAGTNTRLEPGHALLFVAEDADTDPGNATYDLRRVQMVETFDPDGPDDPRPAYTKVTLDRSIRFLMSSDNAEIHALRQRTAAFGHNAIRWEDLPLPLRVGEISPVDGTTFLPGPYANAKDNWANGAYSSSLSTLYLDQVYPRLVKNSWIVMSNSSSTALYRVSKVRERTRTQFLVTGKASRLSINGAGAQNFTPRNVSVYCESEHLTVSERPRTLAVSGTSVVLNSAVEGLEPGRHVALTGLSTDGGAVSEVLAIKQVSSNSAGFTRLTFEVGMAHVYDRLSLRINANVTAANMGVTRGEILGDGNAAQPFQRFDLQSVPLTYVSTNTPTGSESTLELRVDGQLWDEVPTLYGQDTDARVYTVTNADDGAASIEFGDGQTVGSRLPSGQSNVTARLRIGIGTDGNLPENRIDQLASRPLGVNGVLNPVPASGAADAEETREARQNAARQTRLVDRIVTLSDYQDFAAGFAGIEKALAQTLWTRAQRLIHITLAGADGAPVLPMTALYDNLSKAIDLARHSDEPVSIGSYSARSFILAADLSVSPELVPEDVAAKATAHVSEVFSFANRRFGQGISQAEIMSVLHACPGVEGVILRTFDFAGQSGVKDLLPAALARQTPNGVLSAELLLLDTASLDLKGAF
ncbi:hypothetical protein [Ruegeria hyattellae]|uniref:hypothetical protein n=1 Tax=Ruegeria hyattellae TaxID=3233337 RepID=UPI00355C3246